MSEESSFGDFKAIRITLSQEAFDKMDSIMKDAKFRSYSSTIEECIRTIDDIVGDIYSIAGHRNDPKVYHPTPADWTETLKKIILRMHRFTGRAVLTQREMAGEMPRQPQNKK